MAFLRMRQRAVTALFPHQGNKQFIIPKRFGLIPTDSFHKTIDINNEFRSNIITGTPVVTGFSLLQDDTPVAIASVNQVGGPNAITVNFAAIGVGLKTTLHYDGTGDWVGDNGRAVGPFTTTGVTT